MTRTRTSVTLSNLRGIAHVFWLRRRSPSSLVRLAFDRSFWRYRWRVWRSAVRGLREHP